MGQKLISTRSDGWALSERRRSRADAPTPRVAQVYGLTPLPGLSATAIRLEQLREMLRGAPVGVVSGAGTVALVASMVHEFVAAGQMRAWSSAMGFLLLLRGWHLVHLRRLIRDGKSLDRAFAEITVFVSLFALLWLVPPFLWFGQASPRAQMFIALVFIGMMAGGSTTLGSVPPAATAFVLILGVGLLRITLLFDSWIMTSLALILATVLCHTMISNARLSMRHVQERTELEEQGQLIKLLREFQSSGSEWLWELDCNLRIRFVSQAMAVAIGRVAEDMIGIDIRPLIDPHGTHRPMAKGVRALLEHLNAGKAFHEIAFPSVDGRRWFCVSGRPVIEDDGSISGWRGVGSDITQVRAGDGTEGIRVARRDALTGLGNRLMIREMLEEGRLRQVAGDGECVLLLLDLDRFKMVNDTLGHAVGDQLLAEVARRLEQACGEQATVGRLGGDEFAVVVGGASDTLTLMTLAERIADAIDRGFHIGMSAIHIGVSIGIARAPSDGDSEDRLMRSADLALYRAKEQGRGRFAFYEPWMLAKAQADRLLENDVRDAMRRGELHLAYQPILDAGSMEVVGYEALLRWSHPERGSIAPDVFVPIIEDVGLIHQIGGWVIGEACRQAASWPGERRIAVNISVAQLTAAGLRESVEQALRESGLLPSRLELEVTESVFMGDDAATLAALTSLQALGVRLVLDDFGKGYSSFGYLSRACFAKIKIDQLFVRGAANGQHESLAIVNSILALANGLGVETTAEGIETLAQAELMVHLGCSQLQGFLFGRPVTAEVLRITQRHDGKDVLALRRRA
jgi:diguanylate cyclase (GGDEF)-like protein